MIARAGVGDPWLFPRLRAGYEGRPFQEPSLAEVGQVLLKHIHALAELDSPKVAALQARKLIKYYARPFEGSQRALVTLEGQKVNSLDDITTLVERFFS